MYNQAVSQTSSGRSADNVLLLCALPGTLHAHHVIESCGPAEEAGSNKDTSSQPGPAASPKRQREGGSEAVSGQASKCRHESKLNTDRRHDISQEVVKTAYKHTKGHKQDTKLERRLAIFLFQRHIRGHLAGYLHAAQAFPEHQYSVGHTCYPQHCDST